MDRVQNTIASHRRCYSSPFHAFSFASRYYMVGQRQVWGPDVKEKSI